MKLKNGSGLTIQSRRGYVAPNYSLTEAEQAKQEIEAALFSRQNMHDIPIVSVAQSLTPANGSTQLSLVASLDVAGLGFRQPDGGSLDHLTVVFALFDHDGHIIKTQQQRLELLLKDATPPNAVNEVISVKTNFDVPSGDYMIRLVVETWIRR